MKRYLLFTYERYYPLGGFCDFEGDYATIEEAKAAVKAEDFCDCRWHVFDTRDRKIVAQNYQ